jgi:hypothetical protein
MKNLLIFIICFSIHTGAFAQILGDIDEVSPLHGDLVAIKMGEQWAFIDKDGNKAIDFRDDLVLTNHVNSLNKKTPYPVFNDGRCLITKLKGDTPYFGFINEKGIEIIKPQFLNATNFSNGYAIVIVASKDSIGFNKVLKKPIMSNYIEDYVIDTSGELVKYLYNPRKKIPSNYKNGIPTIESKFIAPNLIAVKNKSKKWEIRKF